MTYNPDEPRDEKGKWTKFGNALKVTAKLAGGLAAGAAIIAISSKYGVEAAKSFEAQKNMTKQQQKAQRAAEKSAAHEMKYKGFNIGLTVEQVGGKNKSGRADNFFKPPKPNKYERAGISKIGSAPAPSRSNIQGASKVEKAFSFTVRQTGEVMTAVARNQGAAFKIVERRRMEQEKAFAKSKPPG